MQIKHGLIILWFAIKLQQEQNVTWYWSSSFVKSMLAVKTKQFYEKYIELFFNVLNVLLETALFYLTGKL